MSFKNKNILFMVTGSVASYKSADVVSQLTQQGADVRVVLSLSALNFVGQATFEGLTKNKVLTRMFEEGSMMAHIDQARWANVMILYPATAHAINSIAWGMGDHLIGALSLAKSSHQNFYIFPAMNTKMYEHPSVQNSLSKLRSWPGYHVAPALSGRLACGETGVGRILDSSEALSYILHQEKLLNERSDYSYFKSQKKITFTKEDKSSADCKARTEVPQKSKTKKALQKILITSGANREYIDSIRYITNQSTGETGRFLAERLSQEGFSVTYLHSNSANPADHACDNFVFDNFKSLKHQLKRMLSQETFDWIIHLAAVSDYSPTSVQVGSLSLKTGTSAKLPSQMEWASLSPKPQKSHCPDNQSHSYSNLDSNDYSRPIREMLEKLGITQLVTGSPKKQDLANQKTNILHLKTNPKIIDSLKKYSKNKNVKVIGFKLTHTTDLKEQQHKIKSLWERSGCDYIVHNDLNNIRSGQNTFKVFQVPLKENQSSCKDTSQNHHKDKEKWLNHYFFCSNKLELFNCLLMYLNRSIHNEDPTTLNPATTQSTVGTEVSNANNKPTDSKSPALGSALINPATTQSTVANPSQRSETPRTTNKTLSSHDSTSQGLLSLGENNI